MSDSERPRGRPFVKGQSGNPGGRPPLTRTFADVLRAELAKEKDGVTTRDRIAAKVVSLAEDGSLDAAKWIVDRTEGKTPERLEATVDGSVTHAVADATVDAVLARYAARRGDGGGAA